MTTPKRCCVKTSFVHDLLSSISTLQVAKGTNSVRLGEIVKHMEYSHNLTGDVKSQIENALNTAQEQKFVNKVNDRYSLLSPAAKLHLVPSFCLKEEIKRIQGIFQYKKPKDSSCPGEASRSHSFTPPKHCPPSEKMLTRSNCFMPPNVSTPRKPQRGYGLKLLKDLLPDALKPAKKRCNCTNTTQSFTQQRKAKRKIKRKKNCSRSSASAPCGDKPLSDGDKNRAYPSSSCDGDDSSNSSCS